METYGKPDNPVPETPPAASYYSVNWGGDKAIFIMRPRVYTPLMISPNCPALLTSQGSWVSWYYGVASGSYYYGDETYGIPDDPTSYSFDFHIRSGYIDAWWGDTNGVEGTGDALLLRAVYSSADNERHWTIRPTDSFKIVHEVAWDPIDYVVMVEIGAMPMERWHCFMMSWVVGGAKSIVYDDVVQDVSFEPEGFGGFWDGSLQDQGDAVAPVPERLALMNGEGGHYDWWLSTEFIDFTEVNNRRRFINADLTPVSLGTDGKSGSPTNRQPEFFFHPGKTLENFTENRGTGGKVRWTDQQGISDREYIDPEWKTMTKPTAAGTT